MTIAIVLVALPARAQPARVFSTADGLSNYAVTSLLQDRMGFVWIGTTSGLNRYDGYGFTAIRPAPDDGSSLSRANVATNGLAEDREGFLWVATREGLDQLDPATGRVRPFRQVPGDPHSLPENHVRAVTVDRAGRVWAATFGGGVARFEPELQAFAVYRHDVGDSYSLPSDTVLSLAASDAGVWVGTVRGLAYFPAHGSPPRCLALDTPEPALWSLAVDSAGTVWAGGTGRVYRIDPTRGVVTSVPFARPNVRERFVLSLFPDGDTILAATWGDGVVGLDARTGAPRFRRRPGEGRLHPPHHRVSSFLRDRSGVFWIGTWDGLKRVAPGKPFETLAQEGRAAAVFAAGNGDVWVGAIGGGLSRFRKGRQERMQDRTTLPSTDVTAVIEDRRGALWFGTSDAGVGRLDPATGALRVFDNDSTRTPRLLRNLVYDIVEAHDGRIWIGTVNAGIALYDPVTDRMAHYRHDAADPGSLPSDEVWTLFEDRHRQMWAGTIGGGLARTRVVEDDAFPPTLRFDRFVAGDPSGSDLPSNDVVAMHEDDAGALWVGTLGGGLSRRDPETGRFATLGVADGLPDERVTCILGDSAGRLWMGTGNGLARFDPAGFDAEGRPNGVLYRYDRTDGLPGVVFYADGCHRGPDGRLYFATEGGIVRFAPMDIVDNPLPPALALTDVLLFNEPLDLDTLASHKRLLRLRHDQHFLGFRFASLDFNAPEKNRYAYRMEGVDAGWVSDLGGRLASYPNLAPGKYTFLVRGTNNDGLYGETRRLDVVIVPALYQRRPFQAFAVLVFLLPFAGWWYVDRRRKREQQATRQAIADDLHDDLGSRLHGIALFFDRMLRRGVFPPDMADRAGEHLDAARRMTHDLRDHVWLVDPAFDTLGDLAEKLRQAAAELFPNDRLAFTVHGLEADRPLPMRLRRHLFYMAREALRNAARHSGSATLKVDLRFRTPTLWIEIEDRGIGFAPSPTDTGAGLPALRRRAAAIGASLELDSAPGQGTTVRIACRLT
jgi:ligand-binding sensor domain-containing protein/signal transduction histidine kinase